MPLFWTCVQKVKRFRCLMVVKAVNSQISPKIGYSNWNPTSSFTDAASLINQMPLCLVDSRREKGKVSKAIYPDQAAIPINRCHWQKKISLAETRFEPTTSEHFYIGDKRHEEVWSGQSSFLSHRRPFCSEVECLLNIKHQVKFRLSIFW